MASAGHTWKTDPFLWQKDKFWPKEGKHILAQFDDETVVVYQAFKPDIANYAVKHQRFGGDHFSFHRMSWIKTNFLWMMYRCGWAEKQDQECVLAVRIRRYGFDEILSNACTPSLQKSRGISQGNLTVRLQWDPDHSPGGAKQTRRAIQMGLKGEILRKYATEWIVSIEDITDKVKEQHLVLQEKGEESLQTASERVYPVSDSNIADGIELSIFDQKQNAS